VTHGAGFEHDKSHVARLRRKRAGSLRTFATKNEKLVATIRLLGEEERTRYRHEWAEYLGEPIDWPPMGPIETEAVARGESGRVRRGARRVDQMMEVSA
jgi:hypothetical protein